LQEERNFAESIVATVREPMLVLDGELRVASANRSFYRAFQVTPGETEKRLLYELGNGQWDIPALRQLLEEVLPQRTEFQNFQVETEFPKVGHKKMLLNARRVYREDGRSKLILLAMEDVTERNLEFPAE
jgi:two-component system CheB/CheR fusion protein